MTYSLTPAPVRCDRESFSVTLSDMDLVEKVELQHRPGLGVFTDWHPLHVEVLRQESGQTWYFVANEWFSKLAQQQQQVCSRGMPVADCVRACVRG